jgi:hypothetical protein
LQAGIDQFDIGNRDGQIATEDDSAVKKTVQQFEDGIVFGPGEIRVGFHGVSLLRVDSTAARLAVGVQGALNPFKLIQQPAFLNVELTLADLA